MLTRAVVIDPRFSTAYGLIAQCHVQRLNRGWGSVEDVTKQGLEAAKLAVETGRDDPRALVLGANGIARFGDNIEEALAHIERALEHFHRLRQAGDPSQQWSGRALEAIRHSTTIPMFVK